MSTCSTVLSAGSLRANAVARGQDRLDDGEVVALGMRERDPVADDGAAAHAARLDQVDGGLGPHGPRLGGDERELAIDPRHAAGEEAVLGERREQSQLALGPAEVGERGDVAVGCVRHGAQDSASGQR